ncbi:hypothetical protein [Pseudonocardia sp. DLS-67]
MTATLAPTDVDSEFDAITTLRACIFVRQSYDKTGKKLGVDRQCAACRTIVRQRAWSEAHVYAENKFPHRDPSPDYSRPPPLLRIEWREKCHWGDFRVPPGRSRYHEAVEVLLIMGYPPPSVTVSVGESRRSSRFSSFLTQRY